MPREVVYNLAETAKNRFKSAVGFYELKTKANKNLLNFSFWNPIKATIRIDKYMVKSKVNFWV